MFFTSCDNYAGDADMLLSSTDAGDAEVFKTATCAEEPSGDPLSFFLNKFVSLQVHSYASAKIAFTFYFHSSTIFRHGGRY